MKWSDLIAQAEHQSRESYSKAQWLYWIHDWLRDMSKHAKIKATDTTALSTGTLEYDRPDDCVKLLIVFHEDSDGTRYKLDELRDSDTDSEGYHLWDDKILLQEVDFATGDKLVQVYHRLIALPAEADLEEDAENAEIWDIPEEHQGCGVFYLWARATGRERWQDTGQYAQYLSGRQEFADSRGSRIRSIRKRPWE